MNRRMPTRREFNVKKSASIPKLVYNEKTGEWKEKKSLWAKIKSAFVPLSYKAGNISIAVLNLLWDAVSWVFFFLWAVVKWVFSTAWDTVLFLFFFILELAKGLLGCLIQILVGAAILGAIVWLLGLIF